MLYVFCLGSSASGRGNVDRRVGLGDDVGWATGKPALDKVDPGLLAEVVAGGGGAHANGEGRLVLQHTSGLVGRGDPDPARLALAQHPVGRVAEL